MWDILLALFVRQAIPSSEFAGTALKWERKRVDIRSPGEILKRETLKGLCLGLALAVGIPLICGIIWPKPVPNLDENAKAYILILKGINEGRYSSAKEFFDQAYSMTDDSELRYLADYFSETCELALNSGIDTYEEGNSLGGGVKGFVHGFNAPLDGLSAWSLLAKQWLGDFDKDCTDVDNRYFPQLQNYIAATDANKHASHFNWWWFFGTPLAFGLDALWQMRTRSRTIR